MKIIEVPVYNEDGSVKIVQQISPQEAQSLLQFAINFLAGVGLGSLIKNNSTEDAEIPKHLN